MKRYLSLFCAATALVFSSPIGAAPAPANPPASSTVVPLRDATPEEKAYFEHYLSTYAVISEAIDKFITGPNKVMQTMSSPAQIQELFLYAKTAKSKALGFRAVPADFEVTNDYLCAMSLTFYLGAMEARDAKNKDDLKAALETILASAKMGNKMADSLEAATKGKH